MTQKIKEIIIRKIFYRFLKEENVFMPYFKNLYRYRKYEMESNKVFFDLLLCKYPSSILISSFNWSNTPQGEEFWKTIDYKWKDIYSKTIFYLNTNLF